MLPAVVSKHTTHNKQHEDTRHGGESRTNTQANAQHRTHHRPQALFRDARKPRPGSFLRPVIYVEGITDKVEANPELRQLRHVGRY